MYPYHTVYLVVLLLQSFRDNTTEKEFHKKEYKRDVNCSIRFIVKRKNKRKYFSIAFALIV